MPPSRLLALAGALLLLGACSTPAANAPPADALVDPDLPERSIQVGGTPEVGTVLTARISPDLQGHVQSWGWHRCNRVPACQTIPGADGPAYTPTDDDAWHLLRVIAVAERPDGSRGAVETRVGPVTRDAEPFTETATLPLAGGSVGTRFVVAPGRVEVDVDAPCEVLVVAGVLTAGHEGARTTAEAAGSPARTHHLTLDGEGGWLVIGGSGDCAAEVTVRGSR